MTNTLRIETGTLVGHELEGHHVMRLIGAAGLGEVYLARDAAGVPLALEVIHDDHREDPDARARFQREAVALGRLHHPNVIEVIGAGELPNGWPFLWMEWVEGPSLEEELAERGVLPLRAALTALASLADALAYAHAEHVVHRDLAPAHVLLRDGDPAQVKVNDFGLVDLLSAQARQMIGSALYMAPEQSDGGRDPTGAADVYALAGIAYVTISGHPPFARDKLVELLHAHEREVPELLSERCPEVPAELDALLAAALHKRPSHRPSAREMAARLRALLAAV